MIEIKMDSPNANPVNPNKNNLQLDYTVEAEKKSTFEEKVAKIIERYLEARSKTKAYIQMEISNYCDDMEVYIWDEGFESVEKLNYKCKTKYRISSDEFYAEQTERAYRAVMAHLSRLIREGDKRDE